MGHCSKDSGSCRAPARLVSRLSGVVSAFGTGFSEHVQSNTTFYTDLAAHPEHTLVHLAMATIPSLHRIGGRGQHRVVKKHQGFFKSRREDLLEGLAHPREPAHPLPQLLALAQCRLRPAAPVKHGIHVLHDLAQRASRRSATGDVHKPFAFRSCQGTLDEQKAILEQGTDFLLDSFALPYRSAPCLLFGRHTSALQCGLGLGQSLTLFGHRFHDTCGQFLHDMEGAELRERLPKDLADRIGRQGCTIG